MLGDGNWMVLPSDNPVRPISQRQRKAANEAAPTGLSPRAPHILSEGTAPWEYPAQPTSASPKLKRVFEWWSEAQRWARPRVTFCGSVQTCRLAAPRSSPAPGSQLGALM